MTDILNSPSQSFYPEKLPAPRSTLHFKRPVPLEPTYHASCLRCSADSIVSIKTSKNGFTKTHVLLCESSHSFILEQRFLNPALTGAFNPIPVNNKPLFS